MVIDFHTHVFPEKIAEKTIEKLSFVSGGLIPQTNGTLGSLKSLMAKDEIDKKNSTYYLVLFRVVKSFERIGDISIEITEATTQFYIENQSNLNKGYNYLDKH